MPPYAVWALIPYWQAGPDLVSESYDTPEIRRELDEVFAALGLPWTWTPLTAASAEKTVSSILRSAKGLQPLILNYCEADPGDWTPQNHSCELNTVFSGLDIIALRDIDAGEELRLDYASFCDDHKESFECRCGAPSSRGLIRCIPGNTLINGKCSEDFVNFAVH